jgi:hypothetical protein
MPTSEIKSHPISNVKQGIFKEFHPKLNDMKNVFLITHY